MNFFNRKPTYQYIRKHLIRAREFFIHVWRLRLVLPSTSIHIHTPYMYLTKLSKKNTGKYEIYFSYVPSRSHHLLTVGKASRNIFPDLLRTMANVTVLLQPPKKWMNMPLNTVRQWIEAVGSEVAGEHKRRSLLLDGHSRPLHGYANGDVRQDSKKALQREQSGEIVEAHNGLPGIPIKPSFLGVHAPEHFIGWELADDPA